MFGRSRKRARPPRAPERPAGTKGLPPRPEVQRTDLLMDELFVGGEPSPFTQDEHARTQRNNDAATLVDEDTMAYVVVRLSKNKGQPSGSVEVSGHVRPEWRNHFRATLDRVARGLTG